MRECHLHFKGPLTTKDESRANMHPNCFYGAALIIIFEISFPPPPNLTSQFYQVDVITNGSFFSLPDNDNWNKESKVF